MENKCVGKDYHKDIVFTSDANCFARFFRWNLDESKRQILINMLAAVADAFESFGVEYMMSSGTLLGSYRHGGFIPWDRDVDLDVPVRQQANAEKALRSLTSRYSFFKYWDLQWKVHRMSLSNEDASISNTPDNQISSKNYTIMKLSQKIPNQNSVSSKPANNITAGKKVNPFIDIFFYEENATHGFTVECYIWKKSIVFPLKKAPFEHLQLFGPHDTRAYLEGIFPDFHRVCVHCDGWKGFNGARRACAIPCFLLQSRWHFESHNSSIEL